MINVDIEIICAEIGTGTTKGRPRIKMRRPEATRKLVLVMFRLVFRGQKTASCKSCLYPDREEEIVHVSHQSFCVKKLTDMAE